MAESYDPGTPISVTPFGRLRPVTAPSGFVVLAGEPHHWELECPGCGEWHLLSDTQLHGRISVDHSADGCPGGYHETHDFGAHLPAPASAERELCDVCAEYMHDCMCPAPHIPNDVEGEHG